MATKLSQQLKAVREMNFKPWSTTLWLVKRRLAEGQGNYHVLRVECEKKLQAKLKKIITDKVQSREYRLEEYSFLSVDQDDRLFTLDAVGTDFETIQAEIDKRLSNEKAKTYEDLLNSWAYVVELRKDNTSFFAIRKINSMTQPKKVQAKSSFIFEEQILKDLDERQVFTIDTSLDFFVYEGTVFILNKREFESALNFRKGMEDNRDSVLTELGGIGVFEDVAPIKKAVGSNLHMLRRISSVQKSGYYKNKTFIESLIEVSLREKWPLVVKNGKIHITDETVNLVITLLENGRLRSPINQELFDTQVKKKVTL